jgi:hypothetical protein
MVLQEDPVGDIMQNSSVEVYVGRRRPKAESMKGARKDEIQGAPIQYQDDNRSKQTRAIPQQLGR